MAAPAYATNLVDITTAESTTGWSAYGGGASGLSASPDLSVQGTNAVDKQITNAEKGQYYDNGSTITPGSGEHFLIWQFNSTPGLIDTSANRGQHAFIGTSASNYVQFHLTGSDVFALSEIARCWPIRYQNSTGGSGRSQRTATGSPGANPQLFGAGLNTTASVKGANNGVDVIRRGNTVTVTQGDSGGGGPATWNAFAVYADNTARRWGILRPAGAGAEIQGGVVWGTASALVYSRDSNKSIVFLACPHALSTYNFLQFNHASTDVEWDNVSLTALGTNTRGRIEINNNAKVWWTNSTIQGINTVTGGGSNTKFDGSAFRGCNRVTSAGGSYLGCGFLVPTVAADGAAFGYNLAADPDGKIDGSSFSKGTNSHHAIEIGTSAPTTMTLRNIDFSGFSGTGTSATLNFLRTTGSTTVNLVGCTGTITAQVTGSHTVTFVVNPVTTTINVVDATTGSAVQNARVYVEAAAGGPLPSAASVTITRSGTTASVSHTAHGLANGDVVKIRGANQPDYNIIATISNVTTNAYDYTVANSPTTPATGTITSTAVIINELTTAGGVADDTRSYSGAQPISGRVRKASASPRYKTAGIAGTISASAGLTATVQLIPDE